MLRVLAYDQNLAKRAGKTVNVAVLSADSGCEELRSILVEQVKRVSVGGKRVEVRDIKWADASSLDGVNAAFVCDDLSASVSSIIAATRKLRILSFVADAAAVKAGVTVGIIKRGSSAGLLINRTAARAEGASFDPALLQLAELID